MVKVSVIVNTVDRPEDLRRCLLSVLGQSYRDFEIIVVNNGLGSETEKLLDEFKVKSGDLSIPFKVIPDKTKKLSYLFNIGWKNASPHSAYYAYCADDTEPFKDWLREAVEYLEKNPDFGGVSGPTLSTTNPPGEMFYLRDLAKKNIFTRVFLRLYEYFVMEGRTMDPGFWPQSGAFTMGAGIPLPHIREPIEIDLLTSGNMVVTAAALTKINGFDENFYFNHADGDLYIRMKKAGFRLVFHPGVSVLHHMRFGPTRYPWILGRDTAFYYLKDVRPKSFRGWIGAFMNLSVFNFYFVFKAIQLKRLDYLRGISGFFQGIIDFFARNTPARNGLLGKLAVFLGFISLFSYIYKDLWYYQMLAYGDSVPFPSSILQAWQHLTAAWDIRSPGTLIVPQIHVLYSLLPLEIVLMVITGGNSILAQRIFHYLPIPLSFLTMYLLLSRLVDSKLAKFFGSFVFSLNLIMIGEFLGGFEGNLYVQAFMPVLLLLLWKIYQGINRIVAAFSYTLILSLAYVLSDHVFLFMAPFLLLLFFSSLIRSYKNKEWGSFVRISTFLILSHLSIFLITAYHSYYYLKVALPFLAGEKIPAYVLEFLKRNVDDTYRYYTLGNALRTGGSYFMNLFAKGTFWARVGFILPLFSFSWLLFKRNRVGNRWWLGIFLTLLAVTDLVFMNYTSGERLSWLFKDLPFLFRFRNPSRPTLFLLLIYSILIAFTLDTLLQKINSFLMKRKFSFAIPIILAVILLIISTAYYFSPALSGDLTMKKNRGDGAQVTKRYYDLGSWLDEKHKEAGFFRTLYLPWDHENAEVKLYWIDPYALAVPINYGAYKPSSGYLPELERVYEDLVKRRDINISSNLASFGVKYVIVNQGVRDDSVPKYAFDYQTPWLFGSPRIYQEIVESYNGLKYEETVSDFRIYKNLNFNKEVIKPEKAGLPPPDIVDLRKTQKNLLLVSLVSFLFTTIGMIYFQLRSS